MFTESFWTYFHELYESIPRQGPGERAATEKALGMLPPLTSRHRILDIGCGSGSQTMDLARSCKAQINAVDNHAPFVDTLNRRAAEAGCADRVTAEVGDMAELAFPDRSFDVLWAEGSIFIIGFDLGLSLWRRLIAPDGFLVVSELCWFRDNPPDELREFCLGDPSEDASLEGRRKSIAAAGYSLVHEFPLPKSAWWDAYYVPLMRQLDDFERRHADHPEAMEVARRSRHEIELFKRYSDFYGYAFFILKPMAVRS